MSRKQTVEDPETTITDPELASVDPETTIRDPELASVDPEATIEARGPATNATGASGRELQALNLTVQIGCFYVISCKISADARHPFRHKMDQHQTSLTD